MVKTMELTGTTEYMMLYRRCHINQCHYTGVRLYWHCAFQTVKMNTSLEQTY